MQQRGHDPDYYSSAASMSMNDDTDDNYYDYYSMRSPHNNYFREDSPQPPAPSSSSWLLKPPQWEYSNFALVVTIFVIGLFQFQGSLLRWYRCRVQMFRATSDDDDDDIGAFPLWWDALVNWLASWIDYARAAYQITTESVRNGLQLGPVGIANHRRRRRTAKRNRCNSIPELEGCVVEPSLGSDYGALDLLDENNKNCLAHAYEGKEISAQPLPSIEHQRGEWDRVSIYRELEPAFLNERDYPAGWLVYHPVLRVVTKTEAETYDREVAEKQQEVQLPEQRNETNHALVKSIGDHEHAEEKKDDLSGVETKRLGGSHAKRSATRQQHANMPVLPQPVVAT